GGGLARGGLAGAGPPLARTGAVPVRARGTCPPGPSPPHRRPYPKPPRPGPDPPLAPPGQAGVSPGFPASVTNDPATVSGAPGVVTAATVFQSARADFFPSVTTA
ncbi:hypothetical protein GA0115246_104602, partial [Streptomyces sp. SolWspMP-sol7th]